MSNLLEITLGEYHYTLTEDYKQLITRNGEPWRDETGDNLIYAMAQKISDLEEKLKSYTDHDFYLERAENKARKECPIGCVDKSEIDGYGVRVVMYYNSMDYSAGRDYFWYAFEELKEEK